MIIGLGMVPSSMLNTAVFSRMCEGETQLSTSGQVVPCGKSTAFLEALRFLGLYFPDFKAVVYSAMNYVDLELTIHR